MVFEDVSLYQSMSDERWKRFRVGWAVKSRQGKAGQVKTTQGKEKSVSDETDVCLMAGKRGSLEPSE